MAKCVVGGHLNTIALFVREFGEITENGAHQQVIFFYQTLKLTGYNVKILLEPVEDTTNSRALGILVNDFEIHDVDHLKKDPRQQLEDVRAAVFLTYVPVSNIFWRFLRDKDVRTSYVVSANYPVFFQEYFLHGKNPYIKTAFQGRLTNSFEKILTFDMYEEQSNFLSIYYSKPVRLIPHVWDTTVMNNTANYTPICQSQSSESVAVEFVVLEPNITFSKNCVLPILIAMMLDPNAIIHIACVSKKQERRLMRMFSLWSKQMKIYKRVKVKKILSTISESALPVIISNNYQNESNYVLNEIVSMNIPLIHNSEYLESYGIFYDAHCVNNGYISNTFQEYILSKRYLSNEGDLILKKISTESLQNQKRLINAILV